MLLFIPPRSEPREREGLEVGVGEWRRRLSLVVVWCCGCWCGWVIRERAGRSVFEEERAWK